MKRVAVLGCGYWGRNLVRNFHALGALHSVCDVTPAGRARAQELAPEARIRSSLDELCADEDIDGVVIATPAETHAKTVTAAVAAGKDVLCEKPLALTYADGETVARQAAERGRILMVGHILEYHSGFLALLDLVRSGRLGRIDCLASSRLSTGKIRTEENVLWSFAPHDLSMILRLVGTLPTAVSATGSSHTTPGIADTSFLRLTFEGGIAATVNVSWLHPIKEQRLVVVGSSAMATLDDVTGKLCIYEHHVDRSSGSPQAVKGETIDVPFVKGEPLREECRAFLQAMETREAPTTDAASALAVLACLESAQQSMEQCGAPVSLPKHG